MRTVKTNTKNKSNETKIPIIKIIGLAVIVVSLLISVSMIVLSTIKSNQLKNSIADNDEKIEQLNKQLLAVKEQNSDITASKSNLYTGAVIGNEIAELQNEIISATESRDSKIEEIITKSVSDMSKYFSYSGDASAWYTIPPDIIPYKWTFNTTYSFENAIIPVLWTCYEQTGDKNLLAYTTAIYNAETKRFSDVETKITSYGKSIVEVKDENSNSNSVTKYSPDDELEKEKKQHEEDMKKQQELGNDDVVIDDEVKKEKNTDTSSENNRKETN